MKKKKQVYFNAMLSGVDMLWMQKQCSGQGMKRRTERTA